MRTASGDLSHHLEGLAKQYTALPGANGGWSVQPRKLSSKKSKLQDSRYWRLNPPIIQAMSDMDTTEPKKLSHLRCETEKFLGARAPEGDLEHMDSGDATQLERNCYNDTNPCKYCRF